MTLPSTAEVVGLIWLTTFYMVILVGLLGIGVEVTRAFKRTTKKKNPLTTLVKDIYGPRTQRELAREIAAIQDHLEKLTRSVSESEKLASPRYLIGLDRVSFYLRAASRELAIAVYQEQQQRRSSYSSTPVHFPPKIEEVDSAP